MTQGDLDQPESVVDFKHALRNAARDAGFETLASIKDKSGLAHDTLSRAFSATWPLPSARTVHAIARSIGADTEVWVRRRQRVADGSVKGQSLPDDGDGSTTALPDDADASPDRHRESTAVDDSADEDPREDGPGDELEHTAPPESGGTVAPARSNETRDPSQVNSEPEPTLAAKTEPPADDTDLDQAAGPPSESATEPVPTRSDDGSDSPGSAGTPGSSPARPESTAPARRGWTRPVLLAVAGVALVITGVVVGLNMSADTNDREPGPSAATTTSGGRETSKRYTETVIPENAAPTLRNPQTSQGLGPKIPASATVEVSCRIFSDTIVSAMPDGYWYRIESPPWNGQFYAAANVFLNGDPPGDPTKYLHATDFAVPLC